MYIDKITNLPWEINLKPSTILLSRSDIVRHFFWTQKLRKKCLVN